MPSPHAVVLRWLLNGLAIASRVVRHRVTVEGAFKASGRSTACPGSPTKVFNVLIEQENERIETER